MSSFNIATRYANALMVLASEKDELQSISQDMELILSGIISSKELRAILKSPVIKTEKKQDILNQIFQEKINGISASFIEFVVKKKREDILVDILRRFKELYNQKVGRVEAQVVSTVNLSNEQKQQLHESLEEYTKKDVTSIYSTDEALIGGFIVKINDTILDASVRHQLKKLKKQLLEQQNLIVN
ncbi:MAG: ATP synthase F1 subunit delta [Bacteroidota bacterium]